MDGLLVVTSNASQMFLRRMKIMCSIHNAVQMQFMVPFGWWRQVGAKILEVSMRERVGQAR